MERRLAAILAADVVGYSRLMGADETGTLVRLNAHRAEFVDPTIAEYHGRIVKLMGDGALVEFRSVVDAVKCALAVQRGMGERNVEVPDDQGIVFRIGINPNNPYHCEVFGNITGSLKKEIQDNASWIVPIETEGIYRADIPPYENVSKSLVWGPWRDDGFDGLEPFDLDGDFLPDEGHVIGIGLPHQDRTHPPSTRMSHSGH